MTSEPVELEPLLLRGRLRRTWVLLAGLSNSPPQPFLTRFALKSHREATDRRLPKSSLEHQAHFGWISRHSSQEVALPLVHMLRPGSLGTSAQSPKRQAYRGAGAGGMVGAPGLSGRADHKLCGNVRPKLERGGRGPRAAAACPARSRGSQRPGAGRRRWRLRWPAPCRHHPSGRARNSVPGPPLPWLAGRDAWSVAARDGPGGQLWQGRGWLRSTAAT